MSTNTENTVQESERPKDLSSLLETEVQKPAPATSAGQTLNFRQIRVPSNRFPPLRKEWANIYSPIVEKLHLQIRMNLNRRIVEIRIDPSIVDPEEASIETPDGRKLSPLRALQKADDFVQAFIMGFDVKDAMALIRLDDIYIDSFKLTDIKMLSGSNLSRAIGRVSGVKGGTLYTIENATRTRVVLANDQVHILGSVNNIAAAKRAICDLVLGSPPGKVYNTLRLISNRMKESF